jgi:lipoprotein-anchoring transpeptidase ErfK/SrfK
VSDASSNRIRGTWTATAANDATSPFYGPVAFGTSARSAVLTDWPDGGYIGIHGTNHPELIPGRISHGCIRLRNRDIIRLARRMPIGTPITIR